MKLLGFVVFMASLVLAGSCNMSKFTGIRGSGNAKTETRNLSGFKQIRAGGAIKLEVAAQKNFGVSLSLIHI